MAVSVCSALSIRNNRCSGCSPTPPRLLRSQQASWGRTLLKVSCSSHSINSSLSLFDSQTDEPCNKKNWEGIKFNVHDKSAIRSYSGSHHDHSHAIYPYPYNSPVNRQLSGHGNIQQTVLMTRQVIVNSCFIQKVQNFYLCSYCWRILTKIFLL